MINNGGNNRIKVYWIFGKYWGIFVLYSAQQWLLGAFWNEILPLCKDMVNCLLDFTSPYS